MRTKCLKRSSDAGLIERDRAICNGYPVFCFRFLTSNKRYSLEAVKKKKWETFLFDRIQELSRMSWQSLFAKKDKIGGIEEIPYRELSFRIKDDSISFEDETGRQAERSLILDRKNNSVSIC